ncbi:ATP-binding protein [Aliamphritea spongicola]|uniref:ATP-binding protein n=1 Tax=Aliamphritea spongicola TaxID=707589 RepID=UPI00196A9871|nr:ATP-binding protein [Aliamphritea spongicola]MBN3560870.1 HAMP domain-containing protein [Aliamphritea spongicola]
MSIRLKTILGVALIEGSLLIVLLVTMMNFMRDSNYEALVKRAQTTATLFATTTKDAVLSYDLASLETFTDEMLKNPDLVYARVLSAEGDVFAESGDISHLKEPFLADTEVSLVDDDVFDVIVDIEEGGEVYGQVEIGIHIASINQAINQVYTWGMTLASVEMLLVALFSFLLGGYLTGQLNVLQRAAKVIGSGKFNISIPVKGKDEIAVVGEAFNTMAKNLTKTSQQRDSFEAEILELNRSLEARVQQRTEELQKKHGQLVKAFKSVKETQAKLVQSEKMAGLGTMAAGVAHEINNPVGFVKSNLGSLQAYSTNLTGYVHRIDELLKEHDDMQSLREALQAAREEFDIEYTAEDIDPLIVESQDGVNRVEAIVSGLRSFAREDDEQMAPADINGALKSTLKVAANQLKYKCTVHEDYAELPALTCNIGRLNQVFMNLLVNAGQAIDENGEIFIGTRFINNEVIVSIRDTGCGMSPEVQKQLFNPFFTTKDVGSGTGLGLSISHGIIEEHGGRIQVQSVEGKGSRFIVRLPVQSQQSTAAPEQQDQAEKTGQVQAKATSKPADSDQQTENSLSV